MKNESKFCTFFVHKYFFGIDVTNVQEIIRYQGMTYVPLANSVVSGLINLRGQIVTAINMRKRLGFSDFQDNKKPTNVIIRCNDEAVSLLVDEVGEVIDVPAQKFEGPPENLTGETRILVKNVCKLEDRLLLVLSTDQLLNFELMKNK